MTKQEQHSKQLSRPEWRAKRIEILERDSHACRNCGKTQSLQIHHRQYHTYRGTEVIVNLWDYPDYLLVTLCNECHGAGHATYSIPEFLI